MSSRSRWLRRRRHACQWSAHRMHCCGVRLRLWNSEMWRLLCCTSRNRVKLGTHGDLTRCAFSFLQARCLQIKGVQALRVTDDCVALCFQGRREDLLLHLAGQVGHDLQVRYAMCQGFDLCLCRPITKAPYESKNKSKFYSHAGWKCMRTSKKLGIKPLIANRRIVREASRSVSMRQAHVVTAAACA